EFRISRRQHWTRKTFAGSSRHHWHDAAVFSLYENSAEVSSTYTATYTAKRDHAVQVWTGAGGSPRNGSISSACPLIHSGELFANGMFSLFALLHSQPQENGDLFCAERASAYRPNRSLCAWPSRAGRGGRSPGRCSPRARCRFAPDSTRGRARPAACRDRNSP